MAYARSRAAAQPPTDLHETPGSANRHPATRRRGGAKLGIGALALAAALLVPLGATATTATAATTEQPKQLIVNGNFSKGTTGWKVSAPSANTFAVKATGRAGSPGARITLSAATTVILGNAKSVVGRTTAGATYEVAAWVRSNKPGVTAQLRTTEKNARAAAVHTNASITLSGTSWRKLSLTVTAARAGSTIDIVLRYSGATAGQRLYADDVSFRTQPKTDNDMEQPPVTQPEEPQGPEVPGTPGTPDGPVDPGQCTRPAIPKGTQFGTSISMTSTIWAEHALADRDAKFGKIAAVRIWDEPMPFSWSDQRTPHLAGRTLVMSFRPKPSEVLAGKHDAELRKWFQEAPAESTIYWNYVHEPETPIDDQRAFTADEYRRAWQHIDKIADSVCRQNMYSTLVLMAWTVNPASKKDWRTYYPGDDVIDMISFDPYNGVHDPNRDYYASAASLMGDAVAVSRASGKPWGIAEIGSRLIPSDPTGTKRAAWLTQVADYARTNGAVFVTYFQSSRDGEWRLLDRPSQDAWRAAVASSPK